ncbi:YhcB family protein [Pseudomonadota bacterium]
MESGFSSSWAWGVGLISFAFGLACGIAGAYFTTGNRQRIRELESELASAQQQFDGYREQVSQHFMKTSDLVQKMTASYRDVYEHLAGGSQALCKDPVSTPQLDIPYQPVLGNDGHDDPAEPNEASENEFADAETDPLQTSEEDACLGDAPNVPDLGNQTRH